MEFRDFSVNTLLNQKRETEGIIKNAIGKKAMEDHEKWQKVEERIKFLESEFIRGDTNHADLEQQTQSFRTNATARLVALENIILGAKKEGGAGGAELGGTNVNPLRDAGGEGAGGIGALLAGGGGAGNSEHLRELVDALRMHITNLSKDVTEQSTQISDLGRAAADIRAGSDEKFQFLNSQLKAVNLSQEERTQHRIELIESKMSVEKAEVLAKLEECREELAGVDKLNHVTIQDVELRTINQIDIMRKREV